MSRGPSDGARPRCGVCADEGLVADVIALSADGLRARTRVAGEERTVDLALVDGVRPGDRLLVHLDMALAVVAEEEVP